MVYFLDKFLKKEIFIMVKKISIKKAKNRIYIIILSTLIFSIITFSIGCNIEQQLFKIPEKIKEVVTIKSDINISPINDVIDSIEKEYLYDIKREELITSAFEGIIKSTDEKYPELLSEQDKDDLEKIKDKYPEDSLDSIKELISKLIEKKDEVQMEDLIMYGNESMIKNLSDKYAYFFYPDNYRIMMEDYSGHISGVGMFVDQVEEKIIVFQPIENTPAYRAGIKSGDEILEVNGKSIKGMSIEEVIILIRGKEGTKVTITFFRPETNEKFAKELIRETIRVPNSFKIEVIDEKIGYVNYYSFVHNGDASDFKIKLEKLSDEGVKVLILDLRGNTGGLLSEAVNLSQLFIDRGNIVIVKEKKDSITYRGKKTEFADFPLVIIVNEWSASASEIFAGAIQDHNRAKLVGNRTFGKGKVQMIFSLSDGSGIKFTTANYYLPSERSIEETGITPDIIINDDDKTEEDEQLEEAIKVALEYISKIDI